jgi:hypothetical protein
MIITWTKSSKCQHKLQLKKKQDKFSIKLISVRKYNANPRNKIHKISAIC